MHSQRTNYALYFKKSSSVDRLQWLKKKKIAHSNWILLIGARTQITAVSEPADIKCRLTGLH